MLILWVAETTNTKLCAVDYIMLWTLSTWPKCFLWGTTMHNFLHLTSSQLNEHIIQPLQRVQRTLPNQKPQVHSLTSIKWQSRKMPLFLITQMWYEGPLRSSRLPSTDSKEWNNARPLCQCVSPVWGSQKGEKGKAHGVFTQAERGATVHRSSSSSGWRE